MWNITVHIFAFSVIFYYIIHEFKIQEPKQNETARRVSLSRYFIICWNVVARTWLFICQYSVHISSYDYSIGICTIMHRRVYNLLSITEAALESFPLSSFFLWHYIPGWDLTSSFLSLKLFYMEYIATVKQLKQTKITPSQNKV